MVYRPGSEILNKVKSAQDYYKKYKSEDEEAKFERRTEIARELRERYDQLEEEIKEIDELENEYESLYVEEANEGLFKLVREIKKILPT